MEIRTYCNLSLSNGDACATSAFPPNSLLSHLKSMGGGIQPKNEGKAKTPVKCYMHYATRVYLTKLFKDYYDGGKWKHASCFLQAYSTLTVHPSIHFGERGNKYDDAKKKIENKEKRAMQDLQKKNEVLVEENKSLREEVDRCGFERDERLRTEREKLGIEKKERIQLTDEDMFKYNAIIRDHFRDLDAMTNVAMKVCVEPDPEGNHSFLLEPFLDNLYDNKRNTKVFNKKYFDRCRDAFFGDISRPEDN